MLNYILTFIITCTLSNFSSTLKAMQKQIIEHTADALSAGDALPAQIIPAAELKTQAEPLRATQTPQISAEERTALSEQLEAAIEIDSVDLVALLLAAGADVNYENEGGGTPLYIAAAYGCTDIVKLLIKHGAQIDGSESCRQSALLGAIIRNQPETFKILFAAGAAFGIKEAIEAAVYKDAHEILALLLAQKNCLEKLSSEARATLLNGNLLFAAELGSFGSVKLLLEAGADPMATEPDNAGKPQDAIELALTHRSEEPEDDRQRIAALVKMKQLEKSGILTELAAQGIIIDHVEYKRIDESKQTMAAQDNTHAETKSHNCCCIIC